MRLAPCGPSRLLASTALTVLLAAGLAGCKTNQGLEVTGSVGSPPPPPTSDTEWRSALPRYEVAYKAKPHDVATAMPYAQVAGVEAPAVGGRRDDVSGRGPGLSERGEVLGQPAETMAEQDDRVPALETSRVPDGRGKRAVRSAGEPEGPRADDTLRRGGRGRAARGE